MQAQTMSERELLLLILGVSLAVVVVVVVGFLFFKRFLDKEKELGERFRGFRD